MQPGKIKRIRALLMIQIFIQEQIERRKADGVIRHDTFYEQLASSFMDACLKHILNRPDMVVRLSDVYRQMRRESIKNMEVIHGHREMA